MSLNFIVDCLEKGHKPKVLLEPQWMTDIEESCKFGDFFELMKPDTCGEEYSITVKLGHKKPEDSHPRSFVTARLDQKLMLTKLQGANYVRYEVEKIGEKYSFIFQCLKK